MLALAAAALAIAAVVIGLLLLAGQRVDSPPGSTPSASAAAPRPLTTEEAERLAVARFLAYQDGSRVFHSEVVADGTAVSLDGRVDYRSGVGIAVAGSGEESAVLTWNGTTLVGWPSSAAAAEIPAQAPPEPGGARPLDPSSSAVDTVLLLVRGLGADRPENAQLLQQSDAEWLRSDDLDGVRVDVIAGPSDADTGEHGGNTRYWIDERGALLRFEADLPAGTVVVDLDPEDHVAVQASPQLG
jgi:hypothetical protein